MKLLLFVLLLFSCQTDKNASNNMDDLENIIVPEGFFIVGEQLYFSDGMKFFCGFKSWEHFEQLRGTKEAPKFHMNHINAYKKKPTSMIDAGFCNVNIVTKKFYE